MAKRKEKPSEKHYSGVLKPINDLWVPFPQAPRSNFCVTAIYRTKFSPSGPNPEY